MKSSLVLLLPVFIATGIQADVLSNLSPFLGSESPDYDPASLEPESAMADPSYAPFSPADSDLGVQQVLGVYSGRSPVEVKFNTSINYTDNAPGNNDPAWFSASRLAVSWHPRIAYGWFADVGLSQDLYRFDGDAFDFENFAPYIGVVKSIPELGDLVFFARYEYQRITTGSLFGEDSYSAQRIRTGFQKNLLLATRYQLSAGVNAAFDINADPDFLERNTYSADISYTYWFADQLSSTLSWRGSYWDFRDGGREDINQVAGLELTWMPCKSTRIFTNVTYSHIDSNAPFGANDFEAWQAGIGIGLNHSF